MVLMQRTDSTRKLERPYDGPYEITEVFTNGTVAIQKGIVNEHVNMHRIFPYRQESNQGSECNILIGSIGLDQSNSIGLGLYIGSIGLDYCEFYRIRTKAGVEST